MLMKSIFLLALSTSAAAFIPSSRTTNAASSTSAMPMASMMNNPDWSKPIPRKGEETTVSKADPNAASWWQRQVMDDVMIDPDYTLTWSIALLCPLIIWYHPSYTDGPSIIGVAGGLFHFLFASLLWVQTRRVRCVFHKDAFEFYNLKGKDLSNLEVKPDNYVVGTRNRWKYDSITNYGFFPSQEFPVICYFKETETPDRQWNRWFAAFDSYQTGQAHFFPGLCNVSQFKRQMELRGAKRKAIPTFQDKESRRN